MQGNDEPSILQLSDKGEHKRVRKHMSAFFTQDNIEATFVTLRDAVAVKAAKLAQSARDSGKGYAAVDGEHFAMQVFNDVVMKVRKHALAPATMSG